MQVQPYVFFDGHGEEALNFYCDTLKAEITSLMRYNEMPADASAPAIPAAWGEKIMHANLQVGETQVMVSDGEYGKPVSHSGFALTVSVQTKEEGQKIFEALAAGGKITMPFQETFWAKGFGMLTDRFGVDWMVNSGF